MKAEDIILDIIRRESERYTNDPLDRGGPTKYGITLATLASWRGKSVVAEDVKNLTLQEAKDIYMNEYLKPFESASEDIRAQLVDIGVNSGVGTAKTLWQRALGRKNGKSLNTNLVIERLKYLSILCQRKPTQTRFLLGWVNRATEFL